jgi:hypothetical protein
MKEVVIEVGKTIYAQVSVLVPEDFDESSLLFFEYEELIKEVIGEQDPIWDEFDATYEAESVGPPDEADAGKFMVTDISQRLSEMNRG